MLPTRGWHNKNRSGYFPVFGKKLSQVSHSDSFPQLLDRGEIGSERLAVGELRRAITAFGVQKIKQAGRSTFVGVFSDVAVLLRNVEVTRAVQDDNLVVHAQTFVSVDDIGQHLITGGFLQLL